MCANADIYLVHIDMSQVLEQSGAS